MIEGRKFLDQINNRHEAARELDRLLPRTGIVRLIAEAVYPELRKYLDCKQAAESSSAAQFSAAKHEANIVLYSIEDSE